VLELSAWACELQTFYSTPTFPRFPLKKKSVSKTLSQNKMTKISEKESLAESFFFNIIFASFG